MQGTVAKADEKTGKVLFWLAWLVYFSSYLGRLNYSSAMSSILQENILTTAQAGAISMAYFFAYGIGQLCNGILGDLGRPEKMVFFGLFGAGLANLLMGNVRTFPVMIALWGINGYLQSMIWPPIIRIFAERYTADQKMKYIVNIASSMAIGTLTSYFLSACAIRLWGWSSVFFVASAIMIPLSVLWIAGFCHVDLCMQKREAAKPQTDSSAASSERRIRVIEGNETEADSAGNLCGKGTNLSAASSERKIRIIKENESEGNGGEKSAGAVPFGKLLTSSGLLLILFPVLIHGMLKDGVTQWVPTYICDRYAVSASFSVILTMVLPLINLSGAYLARFAQKKNPDREMENSAVFFAVAAMALCGLLLLNGVSAVLSVLLFAVITSCMLAVNTLYVSMIPMHFEAAHRVSTVSGFLNAVAYIGSAVSTFLIGVLVERGGWPVTMGSWILATVAALAVAVVLRKKRFGYSNPD